jgi:hypothetical protein
LNEGVSFEVSYAAWLERRRDVAVNRVLWSQFFGTDRLQAAIPSGKLALELSKLLSEAFASAINVRKRLPKVSKERTALLEELRARNLLEG